MAWCLHEHVLRGEIDNRTRGRVTGSVWLAGLDRPLELELSGDCEPDLAGCLLRFENPAPQPLTTPPPALAQRGLAGVMTGARRVGVLEIPLAEAFAMEQRGQIPPEQRAHLLYLEWFSRLSGEMRIEGVGYRLEVSAPAWRLTVEEQADRERQRAEGRTAFAIATTADGEDGEWDEFRSEQFLREGEARTEKYGRLLKQYAEHPDGERLIAREMGWTWLEEALEAQDDEPEEPSAGALGEDDWAAPEPAPDPAREGIDWVRDEHGRPVHPIARRAREAVHGLLDELRAAGKFPESDDEALGDFVGHCMKLSAKLAGALGSVARGDGIPDRGLLIAWLKRTLEIQNQALLAADALTGALPIPAARFTHYRAELFGLREEILALIGRLRG